MAVDEFSAHSTVFLEWLAKIGVAVSPKMALVDLRAQGRGRGPLPVATQDFDEDELVFSIPRNSVLNLQNWIQNRGNLPGGLTASALAELPAWLALTIIIMIELQTSDSPFAPYFSVLPTHLDTLTFWSTVELQELQASAVTAKIGKASAEQLYQQYVAPLGLLDASCERFHHVASIIMAYAFDIPENTEEKEEGEEEFIEDDEDDAKVLLSMVPLADMLNADAELNNARLCTDNEALEMRTIKPIRKGEEILNDYGLLPRSALLRRYGYITDEYARFDVVEISTESILSSFEKGSFVDVSGQPLLLKPEQINGRTELAKREDVFEDSYDIGFADEDGPGISDELVALIFLLVSDRTILQKINESSLPSRSRMTTETVGTVLAQLLQRRQAEYATSLQDDERLLASGTASGRLRMALQVRLGEKKVLQSALDEVRMYGAKDKAKRSGSDESRSAKKMRHN